MKYVLMLLALGSLVAPVHGQWSEPADVGIDPTLNDVGSFQLAAAGGDTLWLFYNTFRSPHDSNFVFGQWSMGDSWSAPETLVTDMLVECLNSGVDPQRRLWLSWYDGGYPCLGGEECPRPDDTIGIWTRVHDSLSWGPVRLALLAFDDYMGYPSDMSFAADRYGNWYMGLCDEHVDFCISAVYSRFEGDTWMWPRAIARGYGDPLNIDYGMLSLVARPDTGFWAVYTRSANYEKSKVLVDHLIPDSSCINDTALYDLPWFTVTADSAGQMWLVYVDTLGAVRSITFDVDGETRRQLVSDNHRWAAPQVCTDAEGWVWAFWAQNDTSLVVSCNWGNNWSEPETVTSKKGYPLDIVSDQHGRVYVFFRDVQGRCWTCYRTSRLGVAIGGLSARLAATHDASVVRTLPASIVVFDAMGRMVANPRSGVYFVREEPQATSLKPQAGTIRKVVIQK
jgi:hypothetical protein